MTGLLRRLFSTYALTLLICASLSAADLESAKRAYDQKDYATALKEFTPLANQGKAEAQLYLGKMYMVGQGVLKDPDQAIKWFKASAVQGNADAQFFLGAMYLLPHKDIPEGVKWLQLSAEQGQQDAQLLLGKLRPHPPNIEILDAHQEARPRRAREQPRQQGGPQVAQVQAPRGRRCEATDQKGSESRTSASVGSPVLQARIHSA